MRNTLILVLALAALAACGQNRTNYHAFDGAFYRGKVSADRGDRKSFAATVRPVSNGLDGARQAARYEGTKHCIGLIGRSDIAWAIGPDTDPALLPIDGDTLTYRGRCVE